MSGFKTFKGQANQGLMQLETKLKQCLLTILKIIGPLRIMLNLLCLCSLNGTKRSELQHICLQHGFLNILRSVETYCSGKKKKKFPFKTVLLIDNAPGSQKALMAMLLLSHSVMSNSCNPIDCSPPGSSVHGIFQARILEWVTISFPKGSSVAQRSNPSPLHWQAYSLLLSHQGSPLMDVLYNKTNVFMPVNTASILQSIDQRVTSTFKSHYLRNTFSDLRIKILGTLKTHTHPNTHTHIFVTL